MTKENLKVIMNYPRRNTLISTTRSSYSDGGLHLFKYLHFMYISSEAELIECREFNQHKHDYESQSIKILEMIKLIFVCI